MTEQKIKLPKKFLIEEIYIPDKSIIILYDNNGKKLLEIEAEDEIMKEFVKSLVTIKLKFPFRIKSELNKIYWGEFWHALLDMQHLIFELLNKGKIDVKEVADKLKEIYMRLDKTNDTIKKILLELDIYENIEHIKF